ncbi:hypothetical protein HHL22_07510 [Hymenobacter sp. RP-2-7]|uniref:Uncharacterized protein n=1 Tax=Hymenobacter polaris TaxID=2682546 RepID=A0A7Y0ACY7_9BACT|nr:hypothetical protein [Hymenobacter polaris]NML65050.1 hypothetical protein [Hymenobacter polaris]
MLRPLLTLLLLLNYLLVVGAGVLVSRPAAPRYTAAHPYVHSAECQRNHYLRLDCFERCNGDQAAAHPAPRHSAPHLLALLKGLDEHCPAPTALGVARPAKLASYQAPARYPLARPTDLPIGFAGRDPRPPCCA